MKKINLTLVIAIITILSVNAQTTFGVKAGANFSSFAYSDSYGEDDDEKARTSMHFGAVAEIQISDKFSLQPELLYSSLGTKWEWSGPDYSGEDAVKVNYLTVPVMAKYYVAEGFSLEVGPQIAFLLSAKYEWNETYDGESDSGSEDYKEYLKNVDFGLNFGVGYKLDSGLNFGARYYLGLSNIEEEEDGYDGRGDDYDEGDYWMKNRVFQISVGYTF